LKKKHLIEDKENQPDLHNKENKIEEVEKKLNQTTKIKNPRLLFVSRKNKNVESKENKENTSSNRYSDSIQNINEKESNIVS